MLRRCTGCLEVVDEFTLLEVTSFTTSAGNTPRCPLRQRQLSQALPSTLLQIPLLVYNKSTSAESFVGQCVLRSRGKESEIVNYAIASNPQFQDVAVGLFKTEHSFKSVGVQGAAPSLQLQRPSQSLHDLLRTERPSSLGTL